MAASLHLKLLTDISDSMDGGSPEYDSFVFHMTQFVPKGLLKNKPNLLGKFDAMKSRGSLDVGRYDSLKKVAKDSENNDILELITKREPEILDELARENAGKSSGQATTSGQSSPKTREGQTGSELNRGQPGSSRNRNTPKTATDKVESQAGNVKKRKFQGEEVDNADPLYAIDARGRGKYDTDGKRGYILIINYERTGLGNDVRNLQEFFRTQLGFEVKTVTGSLTADQVWRGLEEARVTLNADTGRTYYAFFCVILSHGNKDGIKVKDKKTIPFDDVRKYFVNSEIKTFTGRPKLFFMQTCRGDDAQGLHEIDDADDIEKGNIIDESDEIVKIPTDADTLVAYANTQGYATFGETFPASAQHTCFINALLTVFKQFYNVDHVEDMMISVREAVALDDRNTYYHNEKCQSTKQMPCTWSTLTKRLYLTAYQTPVD